MNIIKKTDISSMDNISKNRKFLLKNKQKNEALSGFESILIKEVFKGMWSTIQKSNFFGDESNGSQLYESLMLDAMSDEAAKGKGLGLKAYLSHNIEKHTSKKLEPDQK